MDRQEVTPFFTREEVQSSTASYNDAVQRMHTSIRGAHETKDEQELRQEWVQALQSLRESTNAIVQNNPELLRREQS